MSDDITTTATLGPSFAVRFCQACKMVVGKSGVCARCGELYMVPVRVHPGEPSPVWRKRPPSLEEVRACGHWWVRMRDEDGFGMMTVLNLHVVANAEDPTDEAIFHAEEDGGEFVATEWGEEWCPCVPPIGKEATEF